MVRRFFLVVCCFSAIACAATPSAPRPPTTLRDGGGTCSPTGTTEYDCFDGVDNDCNGLTDCAEALCGGFCPDGPGTDAGTGTGSNDECGEALHGGATLAIPDGVGMSYETSLDISGFDEGQRLSDLNTFIGTCVTMEHSWLRDLQIELQCPSGQTVVLNEFLGRNGGQVYMGIPDDYDGTNPRPGTGYRYCWTTAATQPPMLEWANAHRGTGTLPAGNYQAVDDYAPLAGCTLNGTWTLRATDEWGSDNGFVFSWSVEFDSSIIPDCDTFLF